MSNSKKCPTCSSPLSDANADGLCPACLMKAAMQADDNSGQVETMDRPRMFDAPDPAELSRVIQSVEVEELLGYGGMGAVYRGTQKNLDRPVALKIIAPRLSDDPGFLERFSREAKTLGRMNHPNIVTVYDFGQAGKYCYLVMELVEGVNLRDAILSGGVTPDQALAIVPKICEALQYAHNEGIVHRDIKPENILVGLKDEVKIADFGLAKMLDKTEANFTLTGTQQVLGTRNYMAPEQIERPSTVDHRADIYSLGVVFYELLTGELPLGRFSLPSEKANVTGQTDEVVLRTLEKEPSKRFQQASEMQTAVESLDAMRRAKAADRQESPIPEVSADDATPIRKRATAAKGVVAGAMAALETVLPNTSRRNGETGRNDNKIVSLPFSNDQVHGGLSSLHGMAHLRDGHLVIEFRVHKLGVAKSAKKTVRIPYDRIAICQLNSGVFAHSIELQATSLDVFDALPGSYQGRLKLDFDKTLRLQAKEFDALLQSNLQQASPNNETVAQFKKAANESSSSEYDSLQRSKNASALEQVTFKIHDVYSGFAEAFGIAKVTSDHLIFEYEIKDTFGVVKSAPTAVLIPYEAVIALRFVHGIFRNKIEIQTNSLDSVSSIPSSTQGKFRINTPKKQIESSQAWTRRALQLAGLPIPDSLVEAKPQSSEQQTADLNQQLTAPRWGLIACLAMLGLWLSLLGGAIALCFTQWDDIEQAMMADEIRIERMSQADSQADSQAVPAAESIQTESPFWTPAAKLLMYETGLKQDPKRRGRDMPPPAKLFLTLITAVLGPIIALVVGMLMLVNLLRIRNYWLVIAGCGLFLLPFHIGVFVTAPAAIWLLFVLLKTKNRKAYLAMQG